MSEAKPINVRALAIPLTVVVSVVSVSVGLGVYMSTGFLTMSHQNEKTNNKIDAVNDRLNRIEVRMEGGVTRRDLEEVLRLLFAKNTSLVPVELPR